MNPTSSLVWQHPSRLVRGTRWWPPFYFAIDITIASIVALQILLNATFHQVA